MATAKNVRKLVRKERLELSRVAPLEPKSSASTNFATLAVKEAAHLSIGPGEMQGSLAVPYIALSGQLWIIAPFCLYNEALYLDEK